MRVYLKTCARTSIDTYCMFMFSIFNQRMSFFDQTVLTHGITNQGASPRRTLPVQYRNQA